MIKAIAYKSTAKKFKEIFGLNLNEFLDPMLTTAHETGFDYMKFYKVIRERHGEADSEGVSVQDVVHRHYGAKGVELIKNII